MKRIILYVLILSALAFVAVVPFNSTLASENAQTTVEVTVNIPASTPAPVSPTSPNGVPLTTLMMIGLLVIIGLIVVIGGAILVSRRAY